MSWLDDADNLKNTINSSDEDNLKKVDSLINPIGKTLKAKLEEIGLKMWGASKFDIIYGYETQEQDRQVLSQKPAYAHSHNKTGRYIWELRNEEEHLYFGVYIPFETSKLMGLARIHREDAPSVKAFKAIRGWEIPFVIFSDYLNDKNLQDFLAWYYIDGPDKESVI